MIEAVGFPENLVTTPTIKTRCHGREDNNIKNQKRYSFLLMTYPPNLQGFFFLPRRLNCRNYTDGQCNDSLLKGRATAFSYMLKKQPTNPPQRGTLHQGQEQFLNTKIHGGLKTFRSTKSLA